MNKSEEIVLKIDKIGEKGNNYWIQSGKEFYSGFKEYEGIQNQDYAQFLMGNHDEAFKVGDMALVKFTKKVGVDKKTGGDKIFKNIVGVYPADGAINPPKAATNNAQSNKYVKEESKDEKFWDKKAYKQCLWGYWVNMPTHAPSGMTQEEMNLVWSVFNQIEQDAEKRFATGWAKAEATFNGQVKVDLSRVKSNVIEEGEINVEDIPF